MENRKPITPAFRPIDDTDVTTWELPEGAIGRLGQGALLGVEYSRDGAYLAVATKIGFWIYDMATMTPRALWGTERGMLNVATFSHDMRWIATGDQDGIVKVWDTQNGQCITKIDWGSTRNFDSLLHLHFSQDGQYLATSGFAHSAVYTWRTDTDTSIMSFTIEKAKRKDYLRGYYGDRCFPVSFSPVGNQLAYVTAIDAVTISDVDTGEQIAHLTGHTAPVHSAIFSPCGQDLATATLDNEVQVWDIHNKTHVMTPTTYNGNRVRLAYTSDGTMRIANIHKNEVQIWDVSQQEKLDTFDSRGTTATAACFSTDATQFAIANTSGNLKVWKAGSASGVALFPEYKPHAFSVVFSQDSKTLVSSYWGTAGKVFWNIESRKTQRIFPTLTEERSPLRRTVALSPFDELIAAETRDGNIKVWNIDSEKLIAELTAHESHVISFSFSPTGEYLVSAGKKGELFVWDAKRWEKQHSLTPDENECIGAAQWRMGDKRVSFHPDGKQVAAISHNDKARVWDVESGEHLATLPLPETLDVSPLYKGESQETQEAENPKHQRRLDPVLHAVAFSPCGAVIACGREDEVILWNANTSQIRMVIRLPETSRRPFALAFSPSGHYLAVGSWWCKTDRVPIQLWKVATGENIHTFWGHTSDVQDLVFSPDGTLLASSSYDGTLLLWDMKPFIGT